MFLRAWPDSPEEAVTSHFWVPGTAGAQRGPTVWLCPWRPRLSTEKGRECVCVCVGGMWSGRTSWRRGHLQLGLERPKWEGTLGVLAGQAAGGPAWGSPCQSHVGVGKSGM